MSATLLCWALVIGTQATAAYITRHDSNLIYSHQNETLSLNENGIYNRNRRILVEEVDKNGSSVVKEIELPDYDDGEELEEDKIRREQQGRKYRSESLVNSPSPDMYGCDSGRENQRRKCLKRQKKLLRKRYRNWKELIRRIIKDLDGKIKTLGSDSRNQTTKENFNFMSGFSPRNVMRKKE